jgi:CheY-like chemotaxis protein
VESHGERGTTFHIYLPAINGHGLPLPKEDVQVVDGRETILLIDDEVDILDTTSRMLSRHGYTVWVAPNGQEALKIFREKHRFIDLVILDMIMPGIGGRELYPQLRQIDPDVKVMLSSGYDLNEPIQEMLSLGCSGFIQKPYSLAQLTAEIGKILEPVR